MFREDFLWGVSTAATQIEGGYQADGKAPSIWDSLSEGKIANDENCHHACNHYYKYKEDIQLLEKIGVNSYRFSINWSRVIVDENGTINEHGLQFYRNIIDELVKRNIQPILTLYHWDLPMWAHEKGGWKNPQIVEWFCHYTKVIAENFSDKVNYWVTFNEPQCFVVSGYISGWHAPFLKLSKQEIESVARNVMLAHGEAVQIIRKLSKRKVSIGFSSMNSCYLPVDNTENSIREAYQRNFEETDAPSVAYWSDPIVLGKRAQGQDFLSDDDLRVICQPLDFYAYNIYQPKYDKENPAYYTGMPKSGLGWYIVPECMYWSAKFYHERYKLPILISENGMANWDLVSEDGKVHDAQRIEYLKGYLQNLKKAADEIEIIGYQYWSFLDNFEWAMGYDARFGLVYVDYRNDARTLKDSAYYYSEIIKTNGGDL